MRMGKATYYRTERIDFKEQYEKKLSWQECVIVHKKLCKHYKLPCNIRYNGRICGRVHSHGLIQLGQQGMNIGVICHEVAHLVAYIKYRDMHHNKKMYRIMKSIMNYAKKKQYWNNELDKRTTIKEPKPEPTKEELKQQKINKRETDIQKYEKKLQYYNKLYNNKIKKARRSITMLKRTTEKKVEGGESTQNPPPTQQKQTRT